MKIIYLHGFNSDGNGSTALKLKEVYGKLVLSPSYDYTNPDKAYNSINNFLIENADLNTVLVGTSLGGFWANYFAQKYDLQTILINPSLNPSTSTKKYLGENKNFSSGKVVNYSSKNLESYKKYETKINPETKRTTILSINDEVIDYRFTAKLLKETKIIYEKTEGHRFKNIDKIVLAIDSALTNYVNFLVEKNLIKETVINLLPNDIALKRKYAPEVLKILQSSYEKVGGLQGDGFGSTEEMIHDIPMWKLVKKDGEIICVVMYKNKNGRKRVAAGTNGTIEGKKAFLQISTDEMKTGRSYGEISGPSLAFQKNNIDKIAKIAIPYEKVAEVLNKEIKKPSSNDPEVLKYPILKDYFYQRVIGGEWHTKLLVGTSGKPIE